ncbi:MAG: cysteine-rich small domain-containing protein [Lachnospiraceae bacterium]|nr:cysteine-rich small domain-containing protein [Lachnospiraceae bacterium]
MKPSYRFFENKDCQFFPCHEMEGDFNCLFCYCPLYFLSECPGTFEMKEKNGARIKVCKDCTFPHKPENFDAMMKVLRKACREWE